MTQEVLKLALEALEEAWYHVGTFQPTEKAIDLYDEARAAIKKALRENAMREVQRLGQEIEQEPVAVVDANDEGYWADILPDRNVKVGQLLYTTPPQQEPVAYWKEHAQGLQRDYDSLLADFQAQSGQKLIGTVGELFDDKVIAHRKLDRDLLVYIKENT